MLIVYITYGIYYGRWGLYLSTAGHEILCVHKEIYKPQTNIQSTNKTTWLLWLVVGTTVGPHDFCTPLSTKFCIMRCYYVWFRLLMQISLADYSAYLFEITSTYIRSILVSIDLFQDDF